MADINITSEEILSKQRTTLKKINFDIRKKSGKTESQSREVFDHGNAASALLYNPEAQTVILTRQFRIATYVNGNPSGMLLEAPAGLLEEGEAPEATIIREIKEETGYQISSVQKVYEAYASAGAFTEMLHLYVAEYRPEQKVEKGGGLESEGEEITVMEMSFKEVVDMLRRGEIRDAKTIILLQYALLKGLLQA